MRDALARAKRTASNIANCQDIGPTLHAQWGIDSPQLKTVSSTMSSKRRIKRSSQGSIVSGEVPILDARCCRDEVTSSTCGYFITHPVVLPAGHSWWSKNAPMRHHRCRSTLRGLTAAEARKIGISKTAPDWPAEPGWGGSAPMGEYKANMNDVIAMADGPAKYSHIDFVPPKGAQEEAKRGLEWRRSLAAAARR